MKILVLRGGAAPADAGIDPADRGITALGTDDGHWVLVNVSATVARQLSRDGLARAHLELYNGGVRAVELYATPAVFEDLTTTLPVLQVLQQDCSVHWQVVAVAGDTRVASFRVEDMPMLDFTAVATQMPAPPHAAHRQQPLVGDSTALAVRDLVIGQRVFCAPGTRASARSSSTGRGRPTACRSTVGAHQAVGELCRHDDLRHLPDALQVHRALPAADAGGIGRRLGVAGGALQPLHARGKVDALCAVRQGRWCWA